MKGRSLSCLWRRFLQKRKSLGDDRLTPPPFSVRKAAYDSCVSTNYSTITSLKGRRKLDYKTQVLSFGDGSNGALGHDAEGYLSDVFEPMPVQGLPTNIVKVAAGHYHSLAVTDDGEVWAWGRNAEGQLGRCEDDGKVYTFGNDSLGQLGRPVNNEGSIGAFSDGQMQAIAIAAGLGHSVAITCKSAVSVAVSDAPQSGNLYSWGWNSASQLGRLGKADRPGLVQGLDEESFTEAKCARVQSVGLTSNREVCLGGAGMIKNGNLVSAVLLMNHTLSPSRVSDRYRCCSSLVVSITLFC